MTARVAIENEADATRFRSFTPMRYPRPQIRPRYDAVVIGAGIGGLTAAAFLAKNGWSVLVAEQHYVPGGYCHAFTRKGFRFDAAVHHIAGCGKFSVVGQALKELGIEIDLQRLDPMDTIVFPGFSIDIPADLDSYIDLLSTRFPAEAAGIENYFRELNKLYRATLRNDLVSETLKRYESLDFLSFVQLFVNDRKLVQILASQYGYIGSPLKKVSALAMAPLLINYLKDGAYFPAGGTQRFADALLGNITGRGGHVSLKTTVTRIETRDGRAKGVILADGRTIECDVVIAGADVTSLVDFIHDEPAIEKYRHQLEQHELGPALFSLYAGLDERADLSKLHRGFYHLDDAIEADAHQWIYISIPNRMDASLAPSGNHLISCCRSLEPDFAALGDSPEFRKLMIDRTLCFFRQFVPEIERHIKVLEAGTPRTMWHYTRNRAGVAYGWAVTPGQSGNHRLPHTTPIRNLFLAGHWTQPGPGVPAVVSSGWRAANLVLREFPQCSRRG